MHIVILADPIDKQNAGIHVYTKNIVKALLQLNKQLPKEKQNKYTFIHCEKNPFFLNLDHHIIARGNYPGGESIRRFIHIPKLIKKINPDAVWEPCHIGPFNIPKNIKRILTIHDLTSVIFPEQHTFKNRFIHKLLLPHSIKNADIIFVPSKTTKNDIEKLYNPKAKIHAIPLGADHIKPATKISKNNQPYILYLGTIEPRKNLEILIEAFDEIKQLLNIPHKLILAGHIGWKSKNIVNKAKKTPDVILKNFVDEEQKANLYANASMFIYPSTYEGFGLPPQEAMAYGTPLICSTGGALQEIYKDHALLFDPNDKEKLKLHILEIIKNPKQRIPKIINTWENTAKQTMNALTS